MILYDPNEQVLIFTNCTCADDLLECRTSIEEMQPLSSPALQLYNKLMYLFLISNEI